VTNPPPGYPSAPPPQEPPPQWAYPPVQYQPPYPSGPRPHEGLAVAALVLGILAACSVGWFVPGAILAIIFGAIAWRNGAKAKWGVLARRCLLGRVRRVDHRDRGDHQQHTEQP
jgi:hypothetical protein